MNEHVEKTPLALSLSDLRDAHSRLGDQIAALVALSEDATGEAQIAFCRVGVRVAEIALEVQTANQTAFRAHKARNAPPK